MCVCVFLVSMMNFNYLCLSLYQVKFLSALNTADTQEGLLHSINCWLLVYHGSLTWFLEIAHVCHRAEWCELCNAIPGPGSWGCLWSVPRSLTECPLGGCCCILTRKEPHYSTPVYSTTHQSALSYFLLLPKLWLKVLERQSTCQHFSVNKLPTTKISHPMTTKL